MKVNLLIIIFLLTSCNMSSIDKSENKENLIVKERKNPLVAHGEKFALDKKLNDKDKSYTYGGIKPINYISNVKKIDFGYKKTSKNSFYNAFFDNLNIVVYNFWENRNIHDSLVSLNSNLHFNYNRDYISFNNQKFVIDSITKIKKEDFREPFIVTIVDAYYFEYKNAKFITFYLINGLYNHSAFSNHLLLVFDISNPNKCRLLNPNNYYQGVSSSEPYRFGDFDGDNQLDMIDWSFSKSDTTIYKFK